MTKFLEKIEKIFRKYSHNKRLYIVPTFNGIKLFGLCFVLLFTGLIYANNFIMFFNFLLFSLFICSMFYTHFNLNQVKILKASVESSFSGQKSLIHFFIKNESSLPKYMIKINLSHNDAFSMQELVIPILLPNESLDIRQPIDLLKRGHHSLERVELWTNFPFSFFRAFTFFQVQSSFYTYPSPQKNDFFLDQLPSNARQDDDSSLELVSFQTGQSYHHIHWKKFALTQTLLVKKMDHEHQQDFLIQGDELVAGYALEQQLSILTFIVFELMGQGLTFGLKFRDIYLPPESESLKQKKILETLSVVGLS